MIVPWQILGEFYGKRTTRCSISSTKKKTPRFVAEGFSTKPNNMKKYEKHVTGCFYKTFAPHTIQMMCNKHAVDLSSPKQLNIIWLKL
jgi:hypothetical protein